MTWVGVQPTSCGQGRSKNDAYALSASRLRCRPIMHNLYTPSYLLASNNAGIVKRFVAYPFSGKLCEAVTFYAIAIARNKVLLLHFFGNF